MLKRSLFCLLLLLSLCFTCLSGEELTKDQLLEIADQALIEADKALEKQEEQLIELSQDLENSQETISALENEPEILNRIILAQEKEYDLQEKLLKKQKTSGILDKIYNFFIGALFGACGVTITYLLNI